MRPKKALTDEQYGRFCSRLDELKRRVRGGGLPFDLVMQWVQRGVEGHLGVRRAEVIVANSKTFGRAFNCVLLSDVINAAHGAGLRLATNNEVHSQGFVDGLPFGESVVYCPDGVSGYYRAYYFNPARSDWREYGRSHFDEYVLENTQCVFIRDP
jgi:hypothetical protein